MLDLKTNVLVWGHCVSTTMEASVHLGPDHNENVVVFRKYPSRGAQDVVPHHADHLLPG